MKVKSSSKAVKGQSTTRSRGFAGFNLILLHMDADIKGGLTLG